MRDKTRFLKGAAIVAGVFIFGINAWGQQKPAPTKPTAPEKSAPAVKPTPAEKTIPAVKPIPTVKPIPFEKLGTFLVDLPGWKADGPAEGRLVKPRKGSAFTESSRYYGKGEKELEVIIVDGVYNEEAYWDYEDWKEEVGSKGLVTVGETNVSGHPAVEVYEKDFEVATLLVFVKNRILVTFEMDEADRKDDLKLLAKHLDWKGIEALVSSKK